MAKPKRKLDYPEQSQRFIKKAKEITADEAEDTFERALKTIVPLKKRTISDKS